MNAAVELRELGAEDVAAVASLEAAVSPDPWTEELFAGELDLLDRDRLWFVALADDLVSGFAGFMFVGDDVHLMNLAVDPAWRRRGIARTLLGWGLLAARERGAKHATLEVRASNEAAVALYRWFGLGPVGVRRGYYPDGEDAIIMWAHDIDSPAYGDFLDRAVNDRSGHR